MLNKLRIFIERLLFISVWTSVILYIGTEGIPTMATSIFLSKNLTLNDTSLYTVYGLWFMPVFFFTCLITFFTWMLTKKFWNKLINYQARRSRGGVRSLLKRFKKEGNKSESSGN